MPRHMDSKETALKLRWDVLGWAGVLACLGQHMSPPGCAGLILHESLGILHPVPSQSWPEWKVGEPHPYMDRLEGGGWYRSPLRR